MQDWCYVDLLSTYNAIQPCFTRHVWITTYHR